MNHNHIYSDSVSCEQLKAVDIISEEEGHVCPTRPPPPPLPSHLQKNKQQQITITPLEIFGSPVH